MKLIHGVEDVIIVQGFDSYSNGFDFRNPFGTQKNKIPPFKTDTKEEAFYNFFDWLKTEEGKAFLLPLFKLKDKTVICLCKSEYCHLRVLDAYLQNDTENLNLLEELYAKRGSNITETSS